MRGRDKRYSRAQWHTGGGGEARGRSRSPRARIHQDMDTAFIAASRRLWLSDDFHLRDTRQRDAPAVSVTSPQALPGFQCCAVVQCSDCVIASLRVIITKARHHHHRL